MTKSNSTKSATINLDQLTQYIDQLVYSKTGKHLNTVQISILEGVLEEKNYEQIATQSLWSEAHVKTVGAELWNLLSEIWGEFVTKKSFRSIITVKLKTSPSLSVKSTISSFPFPDGPVKLDSGLYCDRPPIESRCYEAIKQPGALIRIRAPRQMGKTSLLKRIIQDAEQQQYISVLLNLKLVDTQILENLDRFLQWFCARVTQSLQLPLEITTYWDDLFGSKTSCKDYFQNYLLPKCEQPLILAFDEIDTLFNYAVTADGFFSLLRAWYEEARNNQLWHKIRLILVHSTEIYIPLEINQSPFNVGIPIELPEFNCIQVQTLAHRHGLDWQLDQVEKLMNEVGGHPHLVRLALYQIAQNSLTLEELFDHALSTDSLFYGHLQQQLSYLEKHPTLVGILKKILTDSQIPHLKSVELFQLTRMGLITVDQGKISIRCQLYRRWLNQYV
jgi:hypothetical protein